MKKFIWMSFLALVGFSVLPAAAQGWSIEVVDTAGEVGRFTSITLDGNGNPHISYYDSDIHDLKYATKQGASWTIEIVDSAGFIGESSSIQIDAFGNPHIAYFDLGRNMIKYAVKTAGWTIEPVDSTYAIGYTSLALDGSGNPHISYCAIDIFQPVDFGLRYATKNGSWAIENVDFSETYGVGQYTSIELNASGNPRISYFTSPGFGTKNLKYTAKNGAFWTTDNVQITGDVGRYSSLALDTSGNPHISFYNLELADLRYATKNPSWTIQNIDLPGGVGKWTSIAIDNNGYLHLSYYDETNGILKYAAWNGTWTVQNVDVLGNMGQYTSLALDSDGNPHISYWDSNNGDLKYAVGFPISPGIDAGISNIFAPTDEVCAGDSADIVVEVRNFGTDTLMNFPVNITITPGGYNQTQNVILLLPSFAMPIPFPRWGVPTTLPATYTLVATTSVPGDTFTGNDTDTLLIDAFDCSFFHDGEVMSLDSLPDTVCANDIVPVAAFVRSLGDSVEFDVRVVCTIGIAYTDVVIVPTLNPFFPTFVSFTPWVVPSPDSTLYVATVCIEIPGDTTTVNDCIAKDVFSFLCVGVEEGTEPIPIPRVFRLSQNSPNPFHQATTITYGLPASTPVSLKVYDVTGRVVRVLLDGVEKAGVHSVVWNGRDHIGARVGSGIYFYKLTAEGLSATKKMMLIR
ncbi:T9SS type A sorting domain-containing protein [candidate division TA06 bacterium]|nr:T9SS type A sorting domain-containing protein [candidate division TA06 bacterium]